MTVSFALNHMVAPAMPLARFLDLAVSLGGDGVEIRNDLAGNAILDGIRPDTVRRLAAERGIRIISINALQRFNEWSEERRQEAQDLISYAADCGAEACVLVPVNEGGDRPDDGRHDRLCEALSALRTILADKGVFGLVEPLGFESCTLRSKRAAVDAIRAVGGQAQFRLVHDTFHHHLAGEPDLFAAETGLVHVSGVSDPDVTISMMRDAHRVLVTPDDRTDTVAQIRELYASGYKGPISFEPFSPAIHGLQDPAPAMKASMDYIRTSL